MSDAQGTRGKIRRYYELTFLKGECQSYRSEQVYDTFEQTTGLFIRGSKKDDIIGIQEIEKFNECTRGISRLNPRGLRN